MPVLDSTETRRQSSILSRVDRNQLRCDGARGITLGTLSRARNIDADEESRLLEEVRNSTSGHRQHSAVSNLWLSHVKLVVSIARRYRRDGIDINDLVGAGMLGLHGAIVNFDTEQCGGRLASYAIPRIRHCIQEFIRRNADPIALPETDADRRLYRNRAKLLEDARRSLIRQGTSHPADSELCQLVGAIIGLSAAEVEDSLLIISRHHARLDTSSSPAESGFFEHNRSPPHSAFEPVHELDMAEAKRRIHVLTDTILGASERHVFRARLPADRDPARLDELATELHISRERVYQLEESAKRKIGTALVAQGFASKNAIRAIQAIRFRAARRKREGM